VQEHVASRRRHAREQPLEQVAVDLRDAAVTGRLHTRCAAQELAGEDERRGVSARQASSSPATDSTRAARASASHSIASNATTNARTTS
jgi:hypothetical protein